MEILILGILLVALMVFASTKIKKSAARAFDEEPVETSEFTLIKPQGFLRPLKDEESFEAYSKDFGAEGASDLRLARARVVVTPDGDFEAIGREVNESGNSMQDAHFTVNGRRERTLEVERSEKGIPVNVFSKLIEGDGKVYRLETVVLREQRDAFLRKIEMMMDSFSLRT